MSIKKDYALKTAATNCMISKAAKKAGNVKTAEVYLRHAICIIDEIRSGAFEARERYYEQFDKIMDKIHFENVYNESHKKAA